MKHIIYSIFNTKTNRYYIGSTRKDLWDNRRYNHMFSLNKGKHHSFKLQSSWKRHGKDSFVFQTLEEDIFTLEKREERETFWINHFDSFKKGYNCTPTATTKGLVRTQESKNKMSETRKRLFKEGKVVNPNPKGKERNKELMAKINAKKRIPIMQYDKDMNFVKEWSSTVEATKFYNFSRSMIVNCLRKGIKYTAGGFKWKYKNCEDIV